MVSACTRTDDRERSAEQVFRSFAQANDLLDDGRDDDSIAVDSARHRRARTSSGTRYEIDTIDRAGVPFLRFVRVEGLDHDWSGSAVEGVGSAPDATGMLWRFFRLHRR